MLTLADIIGAIESGGNPRAERFEKAMFLELDAHLLNDTPTVALSAVLARIMAVHGCNLVTALRINCTSLGRYQALGETLYGHGYGKSYLDFVASVEDQLAEFGRATAVIAFTVDQLRADEGARLTFAAHYNGTANAQAYADRIAAEIARQDGIAT